MLDCSISAANNGGLALNQLYARLFARATHPRPTRIRPSLYSLDPHLVTPYTQQWHLGLEYQLPADTVLEVSYGGSRGLKLFAFYNGNQAVPVSGTESIPTAPRRPANNNDWPGGQRPLRCESCQRLCGRRQFAIPRSMSRSTPSARMRSRTTTRCRFGWRSATLTDCSTKLAYTFAHALDNASSASLGSVNNGDFQDQRFPNQNYGNADFDVRQRFVFSYVYDLPFGHGRTLLQGRFRCRKPDHR